MPSGVPRIPEPREWVLTRRCSCCRATKPWALFSPRRYWPDGTVRQVQAWCRACKIELEKRVNRPITPERRRYLAAAKRRKRAALRADRGLGPRLPVAPFKGWLERVREEEGGLAALAEDAGLHEDTLAKVLSRNVVVSTRTAEAALCARGRMLQDLYPEFGVVGRLTARQRAELSEALSGVAG